MTADAGTFVSSVCGGCAVAFDVGPCRSYFVRRLLQRQHWHPWFPDGGEFRTYSAQIQTQPEKDKSMWMTRMQGLCEQRYGDACRGNSWSGSKNGRSYSTAPATYRIRPSPSSELPMSTVSQLWFLWSTSRTNLLDLLRCPGVLSCIVSSSNSTQTTRSLLHCKSRTGRRRRAVRCGTPDRRPRYDNRQPRLDAMRVLSCQPSAVPHVRWHPQFSTNNTTRKPPPRSDRTNMHVGTRSDLTAMEMPTLGMYRHLPERLADIGGQRESGLPDCWCFPLLVEIPCVPSHSHRDVTTPPGFIIAESSQRRHYQTPGNWSSRSFPASSRSVTARLIVESRTAITWFPVSSIESMIPHKYSNHQL